MLFHEHRHGRLSTADYHIQTAIWVSENVNQYRFRPYPSLSPVTLEYIRARNSGVRGDRDQQIHRRIGEWTQTIRVLIEQNSGDHSLLIWCREKLLSGGLTTFLQALENRSIDFMVEPPEYLQAAIRCQVLDSRNRREER
jgi:hypothetical protein